MQCACHELAECFADLEEAGNRRVCADSNAGQVGKAILVVRAHDLQVENWSMGGN